MLRVSGTLAELHNLRERYPDYMLPVSDFRR
jgi:hypothetical protein